MSRLIPKLVDSAKHPIVFGRKVLHRVPNSRLKRQLMHFPTERDLTQSLNTICRDSKDGWVFVFPSPSCPWGYMFQRPQQLATALARAGYTVLYMVDTSYPYSPDWAVRGVVRLGDSPLYLYNDGLAGNLLSKVEFTRLIFWQYWPHQSSTFQRVSGSSNRVYHIYDCIDDLSTFIPYPGISDDFTEGIKSSDLVLASSRIIHTELASIRPDVLLVPNGVETQDFAPYSPKQVQSENPIVGYYGAIAPWFDFELLACLAVHNPSFRFQLWGQVYPEVESEIVRLSKYDNVSVFPRVSYSEIPKVLDTFDVAILPFLRNEITERTSPVKVFEYLAGGKPTVSVDIFEIRYIDNVLVASTHEEFENQVYRALELASDFSYVAALRTTAEHNTWRARVDSVLDRMSRGTERTK